MEYELKEEKFWRDVRIARASYDITQKQVAEELGVKEPAFSLWEAGKRKLPAGRFMVLCHMLDLDPMNYYRSSDLPAWKKPKDIHPDYPGVKSQEELDRIQYPMFIPDQLGNYLDQKDIELAQMDEVMGMDYSHDDDEDNEWEGEYRGDDGDSAQYDEWVRRGAGSVDQGLGDRSYVIWQDLPDTKGGYTSDDMLEGWFGEKPSDLWEEN